MIKHIFYNDLEGWWEDPVYMVSNRDTFEEGYLIVYTLQDDIKIYSFYDYLRRQELLDLKIYLQNIPFTERIELS